MTGVAAPTHFERKSVSVDPEDWRGYGGTVLLTGRILSLTKDHAKLSRVSFVREMPDLQRDYLWTADRADWQFTWFEPQDREHEMHALQVIMKMNGGWAEWTYDFDMAGFFVGPGETDGGR